MAKTVQIRNVPDKLHRTLKARAAAAGMSLSEYLLRELRRVGEKPAVEEILERIQNREPVPGLSSAEYVRRARAEREARMKEWASDLGRR